jgi:hypothetical protein
MGEREEERERERGKGERKIIEIYDIFFDY